MTAEALGAICRAEGFPVISEETAAYLARLVSDLRPKKILEIGTALGYSAAVMLSACGARLVSIESRESSHSRAKGYLSEMFPPERFTLHLGDAREIVPLMSGEYDFIFLDGPKAQYHNFYPYLKALLAPHGTLVADNVRYHGMAAQAGRGVLSRRDEAFAGSIAAFCRMLESDGDFRTEWKEIGDGLAVARRKG